METGRIHADVAVRPLIRTAAGCSGNPDKKAIDLTVTPPKSDGATADNPATSLLGYL